MTDSTVGQVSVDQRQPSEDPEYRAKGRKTLRAAIFAFFVDMFDVYLPVIALAPAINYFVQPGATQTEMATLTAAIFAVSLVGRPIGSIVFGILGDRIGRRKTTVIVAAGFASCTGMIACLPGYAAIGWLAPALLLLLRLVNGAFLGGEYTAANPLAMEYAPRHRRGLYGSLLNIGYPAALGFITILTAGTLQIFPQGDASSAYSMWGWRIPFIVGFILSVMVFLHYSRSIPESELWSKATPVANPLRTLFSGRNLKSFLVAAVTSTGTWFIMNGTIGVFAGHFKLLGTQIATINTTVLIAAVIGMTLFPFVGMAGQKLGRRPVYLVIGTVNLTVSPLSLLWAINNPGSTAAVVVGGAAAIVSGLVVFAMITAYIMEMFPTEIRSSGYGIAYSLPSVIPAFYPYYLLGLSAFMPYAYTPIVILVLGSVLLCAGALLSKDLRHVEL
ncbi:MFS transporter [Arthrobacter sp. AB6]|uniref:MFS transporter n=1 Tax=Arthrobacter sp. AB6 TaxID=2962570 RepID=UPI002880C173|nr:MFS transporter [Arthrobacter sp. AB6]MDT0196676.1 MFS transporter [Arthrobacter sp. AB6]